MRVVFGLAAGLALAACGSDKDGDATTISIQGDNASGISATAGKDGAVKIDTPIFKGEFKMPKIQLDAGNFEINGVHLPPGSKITGMNIADGEGEADGQMRVTFASPVSAGELQRWFAQRLPDTGFKLTATGNALSGTTDDGKAFRLQASEAKPGASTGTITIG